MYSWVILKFSKNLGLTPYISYLILKLNIGNSNTVIPK